MSEELKISDCRFREEEIGKHISSSKVKYTWEFTYEGEGHKIELFDSKMSRKKKIIADEKVILPDKQ